MGIAKAEEVDGGENLGDTVFVILMAEKMFFKAESNEQMDKWINHIKEVSERNVVNPLPSVGSLRNPEKASFLQKQGHVRKNWTQRWCILKNGTMYYYKTVKDSSPRGIVALRGASCWINDHSKARFEVVTSDNVIYLFAAPSAKEMQDWLDKINISITQFKEENESRPIRKLSNRHSSPDLDTKQLVTPFRAEYPTIKKDYKFSSNLASVNSDTRNMLKISFSSSFTTQNNDQNAIKPNPNIHDNTGNDSDDEVSSLVYSEVSTVSVVQPPKNLLVEQTQEVPAFPIQEQKKPETVTSSDSTVTPTIITTTPTTPTISINMSKNENITTQQETKPTSSVVIQNTTQDTITELPKVGTIDYKFVSTTATTTTDSYRTVKPKFNPAELERLKKCL